MVGLSWCSNCSVGTPSPLLLRSIVILHLHPSSIRNWLLTAWGIPAPQHPWGRDLSEKQNVQKEQPMQWYSISGPDSQNEGWITHIFCSQAITTEQSSTTGYGHVRMRWLWPVQRFRLHLDWVVSTSHSRPRDLSYLSIQTTSFLAHTMNPFQPTDSSFCPRKNKDKGKTRPAAGRGKVRGRRAYCTADSYHVWAVLGTRYIPKVCSQTWEHRHITSKGKQTWKTLGCS